MTPENIGAVQAFVELLAGWENKERRDEDGNESEPRLINTKAPVKAVAKLLLRWSDELTIRRCPVFEKHGVQSFGVGSGVGRASDSVQVLARLCVVGLGEYAEMIVLFAMTHLRAFRCYRLCSDFKSSAPAIPSSTGHWHHKSIEHIRRL
jgi:hypothetical protein